MKFEDFAENALIDMIKTPVPKTRFYSKNYNYSISFENTKFNWYSSPMNNLILSITGANVDFFCITRHGDFLKTYILPSRQFSDMKEFAKVAIQNAIEEYQEIYKQYKVNENGMKRIEKSSLSGFAFEGIATGKNDKQYFTYNYSVYFVDKVLILVAIVPAFAPREIFWEVKQIIDSVELISEDNGNNEEYANIYRLDKDNPGLLIFGYIDELLKVVDKSTNFFLKIFNIDNGEDNNFMAYTLVLLTFTYLGKQIAKKNTSDGFPQFVSFAFLHAVQRNKITTDLANNMLKEFINHEQEFVKMANAYPDESEDNITARILTESAKRLASQIFNINIENEQKQDILMLVVNEWCNNAKELTIAYSNYLRNLKNFHK